MSILVTSLMRMWTLMVLVWSCETCSRLMWTLSSLWRHGCVRGRVGRRCYDVLALGYSVRPFPGCRRKAIWLCRLSRRS